ncbi:MAG: glycosyltransferase family 4 protein [Marinilabiliaceae bacterium]|nr:glycosyltransferase family 4 protein [Marinilabiliaceae bacterium]
MLNILINAYACSPNMGSEPGMAWNWCVNLAKHCELFIITEEEFRDKIGSVVPTLPQGGNMHFYFNPVTPEVRRMCWNQGDWRFYWHYRQWQERTLSIAKRICNEHKIDVIHQLNMIGYREPGLLWNIKGPKFVWGPIGGMETMPIAYLKGAGIKSVLFNLVKNIINSLQYRFQPNVRAAVKRADALIAATSGCKKKLQDFYHKQVYLINETGCEVLENVERVQTKSDVMNLLWVGKFDFRKQLHLAIKVIAELKDLNIVLQIAGSGNSEPYQRLANELEVSNKIKFLGQINHEEINALMRQSDVFLFTSIMDATSTVVMEALQNRLPIVCFDTCGFGTVVNEAFGIKIPVSTPKQSVRDFAEALRGLYNDRELLQKLSDRCKERIKEFEWGNKAEKMVEIYNSIC